MEGRSPKSGFWPPLKALKKPPSTLLPASGGSWFSLKYPNITLIATSKFSWPSVCLCVYSPFLSFTKKLGIGFKTHFNSGLSLDIFILITFAKTFTPNMITFWVDFSFVRLRPPQWAWPTF